MVVTCRISHARIGAVPHDSVRPRILRDAIRYIIRNSEGEDTDASRIRRTMRKEIDGLFLQEGVSRLIRHPAMRVVTERRSIGLLTIAELYRSRSF